LARVTLRQLEAFVAVAEKGAFTRAAYVLRVAQPVVSGLIRELESELALRLFDRSTRRVRLTEAGEDFVPEARRLDRFTDLLNRKGFRIWGEYDSRCWLGWRPASDGPTNFQRFA